MKIAENLDQGQASLDILAWFRKNERRLLNTQYAQDKFSDYLSSNVFQHSVQNLQSLLDSCSQRWLLLMQKILLVVF